MNDRESTNILANGAIRYGIYDENGTLIRYEYIKLEDEPTIEGSLYNKANVLPNSVTSALGISTNSEPKDAFLALKRIINQRKTSTFERFMSGGVV